MKRVLMRLTALLCMLFVLSGCIRVVNDVRPSGSNMDIASSDGTAGGAREDGEEEAPAMTDRRDDVEADDAEGGADDAGDDDADAKVRFVLSEDTYEEIKHIGAGEYFAVRNGGQWGVVDASGREIHPQEYDYIETDGNGLFSLTKTDGDMFDARVMYYDAKTGKDEEVFTNGLYPEYDFTEFYTPFITMTPRGSDKLDIMYVEVERIDGFEFDFYRHSKFDRDAVTSAGMDASKWEGATGFMKTMTSDGGSFISADDWVQEGSGNTNVVGIDGVNQIVLSEIERGRTIKMMPFAGDDAGYYAAYIVELPSENMTPGYGNLKEMDFSAAGLKAFPSEVAEVIPDLSSGTARAGRSGRAVVANGDGNEAIFNYGTGKTETEFSYKSILLSGDNRYPSVAREDNKYVYITPNGETRDAGEPEYAGASLYDEVMGYALVIDTNGNLFAIDRNGNRSSVKEEGFEDSRVSYLNGSDSHAFLLETDGKARICVLEEAE